MTIQRISASSYSNTAPLIWSFLYGSKRGRYELILDTAPARSAELLASSRVDAALVPVIAYQYIENVWLVPDVCVGADKTVQSVCLVTKGHALKDVTRVALDISSRTSVAMTKIIFREFLGTDPDFVDAKPNLNVMLENADCALLIGDPALLINERTQNGVNHLRIFDLVELWRENTGLGFVFAMWMSRFEKCDIDFRTARDEGLDHLDEIISNYDDELALSHNDFKNYLRNNIGYSVSESMQKGLELFFELAQKNGLTNSNRELRYTI